MKIGRWEGNEIIYTIDVNGNSVNLIEDFDFTMDILGANMVVDGMVVTEAAVPNMTVLISAGIAKDFTVGTFLIGEALVGTVTASDPILDRRDNVEIRRIIEDISPSTRQFKNPDTEDITESTIYTEAEYKTEVQINAGIPGASPSAPATTAGWIKIAEISVLAASLTVIDAIIYNIDAEKAGVANTSWTSDISLTHRNGTISEMKTKITDNEANIAINTPAIATNVTAIGLNTTYRTEGFPLVYDLTSADVEVALPARSGIPQTRDIFWTNGGTYKLTIREHADDGGALLDYEGEGEGHISLTAGSSEWLVKGYEDYLGDVVSWKNVNKTLNGEQTGQAQVYADDYTETNLYTLLSTMLINDADACSVTGGYTNNTTGIEYTAMRAYRVNSTTISIYTVRSDTGARGTISTTNTASGSWVDNNVTGLQFSLVDARWKT